MFADIGEEIKIDKMAGQMVSMADYLSSKHFHLVINLRVMVFTLALVFGLNLKTVENIDLNLRPYSLLFGQNGRVKLEIA